MEGGEAHRLGSYKADSVPFNESVGPHIACVKYGTRTEFFAFLDFSELEPKNVGLINTCDYKAI